MRASKAKAATHRGPGTIRLIAGTWKRRVLQVVEVEGLRPTPDRVRETLFNWLTHAFGDLGGITVLDLFAGTGALGLEAASRGAAEVTLVEADARAADALRAACTLLEADQVVVRQGDAITIGRALRDSARTFDVVLLDPPFAQRWLDTALPLAADLCAPGGFVYVESDRALGDAEFLTSAFELYRADKAGDVFYHLLRRNI